MALDWSERRQQLMDILPAVRNSQELELFKSDLEREGRALRNLGDWNLCGFLSELHEALEGVVGEAVYVRWNAFAITRVVMNGLRGLVQQATGFFVQQADFECFTKLAALAGDREVWMDPGMSQRLREEVRTLVEQILAASVKCSMSDDVIRTAWRFLAQDSRNISERAKVAATTRVVLASTDSWMDEEVKRTLVSWLGEATRNK